jgi:hypothetical protein
MRELSRDAAHVIVADPGRELRVGDVSGCGQQLPAAEDASDITAGDETAFDRAGVVPELRGGAHRAGARVHDDHPLR